MKKRLTLKDNQSDENQTRFEIDLPELFRLLLRRRRWIVGLTGLVAMATVAIMLSTPNRYTSYATILPSGKSNNLSALRAMAGLAGGLGMNDENSSALYPVILNSQLVQDALLFRSYQFSFRGEEMELTLPEYIGRDDPDRLRRALSGMTGISTNSRTGEITLSVETEYPEFSRALVTEYIDQLENFNLHSRRSEASDRVRYLTREAENRRLALEAAEDSLEAFQAVNRNWASSTNPVLLKQLARLKRDVEVKGKTYGYLLQEFEVAKLDAQKDVPIVRILGEASLPTQKSGPFRSITVIMATMITLALVVMAIFIHDLVKKTSAQIDTNTRGTIKEDLRGAFPRTSRILTAWNERKQTRETISVDS